MRYLHTFLCAVAAPLLSFLCACGVRTTPAAQAENPKPRMILTCDPECDDNNSMIRYLLFASDFRTEAIVYSSSEFHWTGDGQGTTQFLPGREYNSYGLRIGPQTRWRWAEGERFIEDCLDEYEAAWPNLRVHDPDYPSPDSLRAVLRVGNVEFEGEMSKDTPGSDLIRQVFLDDEPGPVFAMSWGGVNTIARALKSIEEEYGGTEGWQAVRRKVIDKVILCMSGNQDPTYPEYIAVNWPEIRVQRVRGGGVALGYHAQMMVPDADTAYYGAEWMGRYITSVGPFGPQVRTWGDGRQMVAGDIFDMFGLANHYTQRELLDMGYVEIHPYHPTGSFLGEGDTGNFLNQIDNGLRAWEDASWGGWAGRGSYSGFDGQDGGRIMSQSATEPVIMSMESMTAMRSRLAGLGQSPFPDFIPAAQNALAARLAWTVASRYEDANHYPVVAGPLSMEVSPGERVSIDVAATDPDGDGLSFTWRQFKVGSYGGDVAVDSPSSASTTLTVPADAASGETIHLVLEVADDAAIPLTRYLRVVLTVR